MVHEGEVFVAGLTQETAERLLNRAKDLGLSASVVRTLSDGFLVPAQLTEESEPKRRTARKKSDETAGAPAGEE